MTTELKPCPFCGSKAQPLYEEQIEITCSNHKCRMYPASFAVHVLQWNTRPIEDALQSRITELEKQIVVWHRYPDEKPEPMAYHTPTKGISWRNVLVANKDAIDIGVIRFIGLEVDMIFPKRTTHWAYLPAAPKGEK